MASADNRTDELRRAAIKRLKKRSGFWTHVVAW